MRRREFIATIGSAAAAWPLLARAQPGKRARRIGVLAYGLDIEPTLLARADEVIE